MKLMSLFTIDYSNIQSSFLCLLFFLINIIFFIFLFDYIKEKCFENIILRFDSCMYFIYSIIVFELVILLNYTFCFMFLCYLYGFYVIIIIRVLILILNTSLIMLVLYSLFIINYKSIIYYIIPFIIVILIFFNNMILKLIGFIIILIFDLFLYKKFLNNKLKVDND